MKITVLGLGEAGSILSGALAELNYEVVGYDPIARETPAKVHRAPTMASAVEGADYVFSLTTARFAVEAAQEGAPHLQANGVYLDLNAASPATKDAVRRAVGTRSHVVDGAIIGSVRSFPAGVQVLLSGSRSRDVAEVLESAEVITEVMEGPVGNASRRKLLRSVYMKGLAALIDETLTAGAKSGEEEWLREQVAATLVGGMSAVDHFYNGIRKHAGRRSQEVEDSLSLIETWGGIWPMTRASRERHLSLTLGTSEESHALHQLKQLPTSAIGDGSDRLGYVGQGLGAAWNCPAIAGPARTVLTTPGDNSAIHAALDLVEPGDIVVVSAGASRDRALIGDLIAVRAKELGVAGMILDGPVRDVSGIEGAGLPVWCRGVSAAGPFKNGPMRLEVPVSIGNAVCSPGDVVVADQEGVLFLQRDLLSKTIFDTNAVLHREEQKRAAIKSSNGKRNA